MAMRAASGARLFAAADIQAVRASILEIRSGDGKAAGYRLEAAAAPDLIAARMIRRRG